MTSPAAVVVVPIGADPAPLVEAMERRNLGVVVTTVEDPKLEERISTATALLVIAGPRQSGLVNEALDGLTRTALDHGTHLALAVPPEEINRYDDWSKAEDDRKRSTRAELATGSASRIVATPRTVANHVITLRRWPVAAASLIIDPPNLSSDLAILVRRAFEGFDRVALKRQQGGKTSTTYRVDAQRGALRPLPFLMKIAKRAKIAEEYDNFVINVADYVPFSSRPDLVRERCLLGSEYGVLVAHFIEHSEPLLALVSRAQAPLVLHRVFEDLLRGWWRLGDHEPPPTDKRVLAGIEDWCDTATKFERTQALGKHSALAAARGTVHLPDAMASRLLKVAVPHRRSRIHGDLHAENIHVRGMESFLIDFGSVVEGPILADPAMLEASLVLATGIDCPDEATYDAWESLTSALYPPTGERELLRRDSPAGLPVSLQMLWDALRVIRMHVVAMRVSSEEYAVLIAAALMRQASFDDADVPQRTKAVSHMYTIASRIVDGLP
jgi:hypothetical protein